MKYLLIFLGCFIFACSSKNEEPVISNQNYKLIGIIQDEEGNRDNIDIMYDEKHDVVCYISLHTMSCMPRVYAVRNVK